jgi:hypothetical protein
MNAVLEIDSRGKSPLARTTFALGCWITHAIFDSMDLVAKDAHG